MFVLKSTYQRLEDRYIALDVQFLAYREATEKYEQKLEAQLDDLKAVVFPKIDKADPRDAREADAVLSASEKSPDMSEEEMTQLIAGERERDLLVSGNYDTDLLQ